MSELSLTFLTRSGCGLCDEMKLELDEAIRGLERDIGLSATVREIDVDSDSALASRYGSDVPVLLVNGEKAFEHRASARAIRAYLTRLA